MRVVPTITEPPNPQWIHIKMADVLYAFDSSRGKSIAKQPGFGTLISKVVVDSVLITRPFSVFDTGVLVNMTTARCPNIDDETVSIPSFICLY